MDFYHPSVPQILESILLVVQQNWDGIYGLFVKFVVNSHYLDYIILM